MEAYKWAQDEHAREEARKWWAELLERSGEEESGDEWKSSEE